MQREDLEHVLRAAGAIAGVRELIVPGSQSLLGAHPDAPAALRSSLEVDICPLDDPAKADLIDGSIGELSTFHDTFGYYALGVGPETATLPGGWKERLVPVQNQNTHGGTDNLLVAFSFNNVSYTAAGQCRCNEQTANRSINYWTDSTCAPTA